MNAYEKLEDRGKQEARDLAILAAFLHFLRRATPMEDAWALFDKAAQFLQEKEKELAAERKIYWESPEGIARRKVAIERFEKMKSKA